MNVNMGFPVDGNTFCSFMQPYLDTDVVWRLKAIETLTNVPAPDLGDLWTVLQESEVLLSTSELCSVLKKASQIIALDVIDEKSASIQILIEDGEIIVNTLTPVP